MASAQINPHLCEMRGTQRLISRRRSLGAEVFGYAEDVGGGAGVEHGVQLWLCQGDIDCIDQPRGAGDQLMAEQAAASCVGEVQFVSHAVDFDRAVAIRVGDPAGAQGGGH